MNAALWAHSWDIVDEGPAAVTERLTEIGVSKINLTTTMHSVQTLNSQSPERTTFFADASVYFQPDDDRYGDIAPEVYETVGNADWPARIADGFADAPVLFNAWVVPFHSSSLGRKHLDTMLTSPFSDSFDAVD